MIHLRFTDAAHGSENDHDSENSDGSENDHGSENSDGSENADFLHSAGHGYVANDYGSESGHDHCYEGEQGSF